MDATLVGRHSERAALAAALGELDGGEAGVVVIEGEPGIGKSRLLGWLGETASCRVVRARATEYEADLPYALWSEALGRHLDELGERAVSRLGLADAGALPFGGDPAADRHRLHRALRDLLERLAAARPLVLCLDDVHWADPASAEALAALLHRPPRAPVLLALAARTGQLPEVVAGALASALRIVPGPLDEGEARELVGERAAAVYAASGGNPFYLEQLAAGDRRPFRRR